MTSRVRFWRAKNVFEAFPALENFADTPAPADEDEPLLFARKAAHSSRPAGAVAFMAHLLPRREAVWWGCHCVRAMLGAAADDEALGAAEAWVRGPDEDTRRAALQVGDAADTRRATTFLARAAGHSGGSIAASDQHSAPASAEACAQAVQAAVVLAIAAQPTALMSGWIEACIEAEIRFAEGGDAHVDPPKQPLEPAKRPEAKRAQNALFTTPPSALSAAPVVAEESGLAT